MTYSNCYLSFAVIIMLFCGIPAFVSFRMYSELTSLPHFYDIDPFNQTSNVESAGFFHFNIESFVNEQLGACKQIVDQHNNVAFFCVSPVVTKDEKYEMESITFWASQIALLPESLPSCEGGCVGIRRSGGNSNYDVEFSEALENAEAHFGISGSDQPIFVELIDNYENEVCWYKKLALVLYVLPICIYCITFVIELVAFCAVKLLDKANKKWGKKRKKWTNILQKMQSEHLGKQHCDLENSRANAIDSHGTHAKFNLHRYKVQEHTTLSPIQEGFGDSMRTSNSYSTLELSSRVYGLTDQYTQPSTQQAAN
eukprot:CAMPEP_0117762964 /NCGR_PEP_ID=MMETSP0947-20121206/18309_1 /TAXON_ID=44440 /ORGANISM="Chattonella subsalsa, Strain CCMP2191" /LENGTH=311 /DNA_ID=CAMNT_0005584487 /DNA_START=318 /DNA_END=1253 /DNA_ORIENTATION=-